MNQTKIYLTYCSENKDVVQHFATDLGRANIRFVHDTRDAVGNTSVEQEMQSDEAPIFLFVSDNFLKSGECMEGALKFIDSVSLRQRVFPIVIDGRQRNPDTGLYEDVPTKFDKVSNVIRYMNYWQDEYLRLRREKRQVPKDQEAVYQLRIDRIRRISNEVGEFLRALRSFSYYTLEELGQNRYKLAFDRIEPAHEGQRLYDAYRVLPTLPAAGTHVTEAPSVAPVDELPPVAETSTPLTEETTTGQFEVVEKKYDVSSIPGLEMLRDVAGMEKAASPEEEAPVAEPELTPESVAEVEEAPVAEPEPTPEPIAEVEEAPVAEPEPTPEPIAEVEEAPVAEPEPTPEPVAEVEDITTFNTDLIRSPEELLAQAAALIEEGNYTAAKENYLLVLHKSSDAEVRLQYARLLQDHLGDLMAAQDQLEELMLSDEANTEAFFRLGRIAEDHADFLVAKNYYERVIALDETYADAYYRLGLTTYQYSEHQDFIAKSYFQEALNLDPENAAYHFDFALLLIRNKNFKKARKQLIEAIDIDEMYTDAYMELALLYAQHLNRPVKALRYYEKAIALDPALATEAHQAIFGVTDAPAATAEAMAASAPQLAPEAVKTILVTGATSGIGKAIATAFAELGHRVLVTGRREERLTELCEALGATCDYTPQPLAFDVREASAVEKALNGLEAEWAAIDVLVNNAGLAKGLAPIHEGDLHHWETMIDTNIKGLLYVTRVVSAGMVKRGRGHIINIGSSAGKEVYPQGNVYCATKFAVDALTKGMRLDLHQHGIKVTAVNPGHVETEFAEVRFDGDKERAKIYEDFQPLMTQDVADAVVYAATRPAHVNVQDMLLYAAQQASATVIDRSGRPVTEA